MAPKGPSGPTVTSDAPRVLGDEIFIRHKLFAGEAGSWRRYADLTIGSASLWKLVRYEVITSLLGSIPGALGLKLRQVFYPMLFRSVGRGTVFGRDLVVRHPHNISIGERVLIADDCVLDARGAGSHGIELGDEVIVHQGCVITSKSGDIRIGDRSSVGMHCFLFSTGGIEVGHGVSLAADCKLGGVKVLRATDEERKITEGPVRIGDDCTIFPMAMVLDGVQVGPGSTVGPSVILRDDVPPGSTVALHQKLVFLTESRAAPERPTSPALGSPPRAGAAGPAGSIGRDPIQGAVYRALDTMNLLWPAAERLEKSLTTSLGQLDSLDKMNLIVETEQELAALGVVVDLTGPGRAPNGRDPFETVESFVRAIEGTLAGGAGRRNGS
jgi:acetyltransferase-like isoleucine patch superfamily enzyme